MKSSRDPAKNKHRRADDVASNTDLEFPIASDFISLPPRIEFQAMLARIAETMPWRSTRPGFEERRLAEKIDVEFVLDP